MEFISLAVKKKEKRALRRTLGGSTTKCRSKRRTRLVESKEKDSDNWRDELRMFSLRSSRC